MTNHASSIKLLTIILIFPLLTITRADGGQINVDLRNGYSDLENGTQDLVRIKKYFSTVSYNGFTQSNNKQWLKNIGINTIRGINVEKGSHVNNYGLFVPGDKLITFLDSMNTANLNAHLITGDYSPKNLPPGISVKDKPVVQDWSIQDWSNYRIYCGLFIQHVVKQRGSKNIIIEIANEPDGSQIKWFHDRILSTADPDRVISYYKIYKIWANAVEAYGGTNIKIAGPAMTSYTWSYPITIGTYIGDFSEHFLNLVSKDKTRIDALSYHIYGTPSNKETRIQTRKLRDNLRLFNVNAEIWVTEWGADEVTQQPVGAANNLSMGAAYSAWWPLSALQANINNAAFLTIKSPMKGLKSWWWPTYLDDKGSAPTATYNVAKIYNMMFPWRRAIEHSQDLSSNIHTFASSTMDRMNATVLVINYRKWDRNILDSSITEKTNTELITLQVNGISLNVNQVRVERFLIDNEHSNAYTKYVLQGKTIVFEGSGLQKVGDFTRLVKAGGSVRIVTNQQLHQSGVELFRITPITSTLTQGAAP